jgi:hypothetical protein
MVDESTKVDLARQDRIRDQTAEKPKPKPQESDFGELMKKGQLSQQATAATLRNKPVTEQAIHEAAKRQEREQEGKKDDEERRKDKKQVKQGDERHDVRTADQKVVGKGARRQGGGGSGEGRQGGFDGSTQRRGITKMLQRAGAKALPADLQAKFAARLAQAQRAGPSQAVLAQQVLNKIVQYVRIGINKAGEKEIQLDLHERIFRGLKLRVTEKDGKVGVHFRTSDARGREVFEKNRDAIRDALAKKGIEVAEITIA